MAARGNRLFLRSRKQFERTREKGPNVKSRTTLVPVVSSKYTRRLSRLRQAPCKLIVGKEGVVEVVSSPGSSTRKRSLASTKSASLCVTQRTTRLRASATILKTKTVMKVVRKIIKTERAILEVYFNVHRKFAVILDSYRLVGVGRNAEKFCIQPGHELWIRMPRSSPNYPITFILGQDDHVTPFLNDALIPLHHRAQVFISEKKVLHLCNMAWIIGSVKQMFYLGIFKREDAMTEVWIRG